MPLLQDLEKFQTRLNELGDEESVLAAQGLELKPITPPSPEEEQQILGANALNVRANPMAPKTPQAAPSSSEPSMDDLFASGGIEEDSAAQGSFGAFDDLFDTPIPTPDTGDEEIDPESEELLDDFLSSFSDQSFEDGEEPGAETEEPSAEADDLAPAEEAEPFDLDDLGLGGTDVPADEPAPFDLDDLGLGDEEATTLDETPDEDDLALGDFGLTDFDSTETPVTPDDLGSSDDSLDIGDSLDTDDFAAVDDFGDDSGDMETLDSLDPSDELDTTDGLEAMADFATTDDFGSTDELDATDDLEAVADFATTDDFGSTDELDATDDFEAAGGFGDDEPVDPLGVEGELEAEFGEEFSDEFSMGDFGAEFGILETVVQPDAAMEDEPAALETSDVLDEVSTLEQASAFNLKPEQFEIFKRTTEDLPLNVKLAAAEIISAGTSTFDDLQLLIEALAKGESPKKIASIVSKISGKRVVVPKGYEKRSGLAFAEEQESFLYQFKKKYWPVIRLAMVITVASLALLWAAYSYIYRPLYARSLYNQGLEAIAAEQYLRGNTLFDRAYGIWPETQRFFDYARAFAAKRQNPLAQEKYEQLLRVDRKNEAGILEYSNFAVENLREYQTGLDILNRILDDDKNHFDALLAHGDIYMKWARITQDSQLRRERHDAARSAFIRLTVVYGQTDPLLFRLMQYFIRTGDLARSFRLQQVFDADPNVSPQPDIYAELAGFYIDTWLSGQTSPIFPAEDGAAVVPSGFGPDLLVESERLLKASLEVDKDLPETHYQLARIFAENQAYGQERIALNNAKLNFEKRRDLENLPFTEFEAPQYIDTLIRLGESNERSGNLLTAEEEYTRAMAEYERAREALLVQPSHIFGRGYANLGDLYYYEGNDYVSALEFFTRALENGYGQADQPNMPVLLRDINYKIGFIHYGDGSEEGYRRALNHFLTAEGPNPTVNPNLLYAKANTLYQLGNYNAASAHYQRLISRLVQQRESIATFLVTEDSAHRGLIDFTIRSYNNLGATMYQISRSAGLDRVRRQVEAQFYLSKATELSDNLTRDFETGIRAETRSLPFLNLRSILVPGFEGEVLLDPDVPKDLTATTF
ncbi:MAG: hypothetical protein GW949_00260 [Spirochaetales bacterium]|nr:hypothetical protein [Spirochaetales bacterium]